MLTLTVTLLRTVTRHDTLLVYHLQLFSWPVRFAKACKGFRLLLEVEEIYHTEHPHSRAERRKGIEEQLIAAADSYLFVNDIMARKYAKGKPALVSYGGYFVPPRREQQTNDGRIHVVYAGYVDILRGAFTVVDCAQYLRPAEYIVHILGFGLPKHLALLHERIAKVNAKLGSEMVIFHGNRSGPELDDFLHRCHIGLNCQTSSGIFTQYSFPSKIFSYLAHGLTVVSSEVASVKASVLSESVNFYAGDTPEAVAAAIMRSSIQPPEQQTLLVEQLDCSFKIQISQILALGDR
jgi:hypothetical protein